MDTTSCRKFLVNLSIPQAEHVLAYAHDVAEALFLLLAIVAVHCEHQTSLFVEPRVVESY